MAIVTTFESWMRHWDWYEYAINNPQRVPCLVVDRSQCTDPFFDLYPGVDTPRPLISGLCRPRQRYPLGEIYVYLTRVDPRVLVTLNRTASVVRAPAYLGICAIRVHQVHSSHEAASRSFHPKCYTSSKAPSRYPPNLAHQPYPGQALPRECCIVHDVQSEPPAPHTPTTSTLTMHRNHYMAYHKRQRDQPVAECRFLNIAGRRALAVDPATAPVFASCDWGGVQMNQRGVRVADEIAMRLAKAIAGA